jgi:photosystem II stability/assembly factor-like uncharacterized protein
MHITKILFLNIFTVLVIGNLYPQGFNSIGSSDGIYVLAAGNSGKIFYSSNGGASFASYTVNSSVNYNSVFSTDSTFWLAGSDGGLYNTLKSNVSLVRHNISSSPVNSVFFTNSGVGFVCGDSGKVYKTSTRGASWALFNSGISSVKLNSVSFLDSVHGAVAGDNGTVYITSNGGASWISQSTGTTKNLLKIKYFQGGIIAVGEFGTLLMKSTSGSWTPVNTRTDSDIRSITGNSFYNIHICGGGGFIRNNSSDSSAFLGFEKNPMFGNLKDIVYTDSLTGFAVSSVNQAIIKTTNGGQNWNLTAGTTVSYSWITKLSANGGIGNNLCKHPFDRNSMFVMYNNVVYVSRNRGENWSAISTVPLGSSAHSFYVSPLDTNIWLCALGSPGLVARTTNYGANWTTVLTRAFSNYGMPLEEDQNNPAVFYFAPDNGGFFKSTDTGKTFTEISNNFPFRSPCDIVVGWENSNLIFVADGVTGSGLGQIFKSSNGGYNWTLVETNSSASEIPMITNSVFDKSIAYATNWPSGNIYITKNFGDTWSLLRTNSGSGWAADMCREDPTAVLTGSYSGFSYLSTDAGLNFSTVNIGSGAGAGEMFVDRGYVIDMRTQGVCKLNVTYSIITSVNEHIITGIPKEFNLYQNYPNPFNPSTNIKFDVPKSGVVNLIIYDMLGREVNTLVNGFRNAGTYEVSFNGTNISSGIYFYRLQYEGLTLTKKLMLIK